MPRNITIVKAHGSYFVRVGNRMVYQATTRAEAKRIARKVAGGGRITER